MQRSLNIEMRVDESVSIDNGRVVVTLLEKSGRRARLNFSADAAVPIQKQHVPSVADHVRRGLVGAKT